MQELTKAERAEEDAEIEDEIGEQSPEGQPAHPEPSASNTGIIFAAIAGGLVLVAATTAILGHVWPALSILVLGLVFLFLFNPVAWATVLCAEDRERIEHAHHPDRPSRH